MKQVIVRKAVETAFVEMPDDCQIICRCEEITKGEIRRAIYDGMRTMNEIKRYLRAGMGLCQGQTCNKLVRALIAKELKVPLESVEIPVPRSPVRPIAMEVYAVDGLKK